MLAQPSHPLPRRHRLSPRLQLHRIVSSIGRDPPLAGMVQPVQRPERHRERGYTWSSVPFSPSSSFYTSSRPRRGTVCRVYEGVRDYRASQQSRHSRGGRTSCIERECRRGAQRVRPNLPSHSRPTAHNERTAAQGGLTSAANFSEAAPFTFCPTFSEGDELAQIYGPEAILKTRAHVGSSERIRKVIRRAMAGLPISAFPTPTADPSSHGCSRARSDWRAGRIGVVLSWS